MRSTVYNKEMIRKRWAVLLILFLLILVQSGIINSFSAQSATESSKLSRGILSWFDWLPDFLTREAEKGEKVIFALHHFIRKLAHFYNFFVIGLLVGASRRYVEKELCWDFLWVGLGLTIGVFDEVHQYFVPGRSCQISDVMVDFSGVLFGACFLEILFEIIFIKRCRT